jgi:hypothetical protein
MKDFYELRTVTSDEMMFVIHDTILLNVIIQIYIIEFINIRTTFE